MNTRFTFDTINTDDTEIKTLVRLISVKGEKGDKGDDGQITNIDQTYNPLSENAQSGVAVAEAVEPKADKNGTYEELISGNSQNLISDTKIEEKVPYNYRSAGGVGNYLQEEIVGGTVVFNQFVGGVTYSGGYYDVDASLSSLLTRNGRNIYGSGSLSGLGGSVYFVRKRNDGVGNFTLTNTHKYLITGMTKYDRFNLNIQDSATTVHTQTLITYDATDRPTDIIFQPANTLQTGFAAFYITHPSSDNNPIDLDATPSIFDLTQMFGSTIADYIYTLEQTTTGDGVAYFKSLFPNDYYDYNAGTLMSVKTSAHKIYNNNGDLIVSYPLDSDLELRGIPKLDSNNNLYYDGDVYESDGTVTRKYGIRAYESGDENLTDVITDKTNTVYPLDTPTTETATHYENPQYIDNNGYEEYTDTRTIAIPVGHNSQYSQDLKGKIENMPDIPPYDTTKTQTLKNVNGTLQWVDD